MAAAGARRVRCELADDARSGRNSCCGMRARGIQDLGLLRALERAPRALFMPQRYQDIAARDIALPIGCGQTAPPPSVVAAMIEALRSQPRPQRPRNRRGDRLCDGAAVATGRPDRLGRALPDAGARGGDAAAGLRRGQRAGGLGGRAFAERRSRAVRSHHRPRADRARRRTSSSSCSPPMACWWRAAGAREREQRIVRLVARQRRRVRRRRLRRGALLHAAGRGLTRGL